MNFKTRLSAVGQAQKWLPFRPTGFTLVELLVVMTILVILAALSGPSIIGVFRGSSLSQGGQMIQDELTFYHQYAVANNAVVEVRFYKFIDSNLPGDTGHYRGIQGFKLHQTASGSSTYTKTPITKPLRLPTGIIIDQGTTSAASSNMSYLIYWLRTQSSFYTSYSLGSATAAPQSPVAGTDPPIFNVGLTYTYGAFQFNPDGSTNLSQLTASHQWWWFLSLHQLNNGNDPLTPSAAVLAKNNYFTIQIDPLNGHINTYRP